MRKIIFLLLGLVFLLLPSQSFAQQGLEVAGQPNPVKEAYLKAESNNQKRRHKNGWYRYNIYQDVLITLDTGKTVPIEWGGITNN